MLRKAGEVHFATLEQMAEYVRDAVNVANMAGLEGADRAALLPVILTTISAKQVQLEDVGVAQFGGIVRPQG